MMRVSVEVTVLWAHVDLAAPRERGLERLTVQAGERVGMKELGSERLTVQAEERVGTKEPG
jgi:hypothetical protein